jgi:alpha-tubulin suppressor-like RCC1 family protein
MLADFGVARVRIAPPQLTVTGTTIGTPRYMAPEQFTGVVKDARTDLYSLGVLAWEMFSGRRPWAGESLANVIHRQRLDLLPSLEVFRSDVPRELQELVEGLMAKRPEEREYSSSGMIPMLAASFVVHSMGSQVLREAPPASAYLKPASQPSVPRPATPRPRPERPRDDAGAHRIRDRQIDVEPVPGDAAVEAPVPTPPETNVERSKRRRFGRPVPPPEALPLGVKIGLTLAVIAAALLIALGLPSRRGPPASIVGRSGAGTESTAARRDSLRRGSGAPQRAGGSTVPVSDDAPNRPLSVRDTSSSRSTLTSAGTVTGESASAPNAPGATTAGSAMTDTAAAVDSVFAQLAREDAAIRASGRLRFNPALARASRPPPPRDVPARDVPARDVPALTVFPRAPSRPLGPAVDFPRETATISAGMRHSCMLSPNGRALCWGSNQFGQLGDGTVDGHGTPAAAAGGYTFARISAGSWHTCGLTSGGELWCWGRNESGQLGDGTTIGRGTPARVSGTTAYRAVQAGERHTCAIAFDDTLRCWGSNTFGELGDGTKQTRSTPVLVRLPGPARSVAAGVDHTCALLSDGAAYCWGRNHAGQLGNGTTADEAAPAAVAERVRFVSIAAGLAHTCGVASSGRAWCWGENSAGQLGAGSAISTAIRPQPLDVPTPFRSIVAGLAHTCARGRDNRVWCWGRNAVGQLGNGTTVNQSKPVLAIGLEAIIALNATGSHTCGLSAAGEIFCWGENADSQLGDGNQAPSKVPVKVRTSR